MGKRNAKNETERLASNDETADFGRAREYSWELFLNWFSTIDLLFGLIGYAFVTLLFTLIAFVYWPLHAVITKVIAPLLRHYKDGARSKIFGVPTQSLGPMDDIFQRVVERYTSEAEVEELFQELQRPPHIRQYSTAVCRFLLIASTLAYQRSRKVNQTIDELEKVLNAKISVKRTGTYAATILILKIERVNKKATDKPIIIMAFKGTSPLDALEWFKDFSFRRTVAPYALLPGLIHAGFFYTLGWPQQHQEVNTDSWFKLNSLASEYVSDVSNAEDKSHLWITGHSLGGATSCIFNSILLWRKHAGWAKMNPAAEPSWADKCILHGCYTYGQPRVGDSDYRQALNQALEIEQVVHFRVSNNLDVVPHVPPGDRDLLKYGRKFAQVAKVFLSSKNRESDPRMDCEPFNHLGISTLDYEHVGTCVHLQSRPVEGVKSFFRKFASFLLVWDHAPREYLWSIDYNTERGLEKRVREGGEELQQSMKLASKLVVSALNHCGTDIGVVAK